MENGNVAYCRFALEWDDYSKTAKFCSKPIVAKAQREAGARMALGRPVGLPWCPEHLARLPIWP